MFFRALNRLAHLFKEELKNFFKVSTQSVYFYLKKVRFLPPNPSSR
jgi:hypothetical protein